MPPHGLRFNPDDDDTIMEDTSPVPRHCESTAPKIAQAPEPSNHCRVAENMHCAPNPLQSELSKKVNMGQLLDKILGTQLTLTVREAIGALHNISHSLAEVLKYK